MVNENGELNGYENRASLMRTLKRTHKFPPTATLSA